MAGPDANDEAEELKSPIDEEVRQLFRKGEYAESVPVIQDHLSGHSDDVPAYDLMATALKFSGDKAGAAGALMTASELWAAQGNVLQSISAQKKAMKLGVDPDFTAARACTPEKAAQRVPTPLLDDLSDEEFAELAAGFEAHEYDEGAVVVEEGDEGDSMFVVTTGRVTVTTTQAGRLVELASLGPGEFFGEAALLSGRPRTATIRASSPTDCLELTRAALDKILESHPRVREVMDEFNRRRAASTIETLLGKRED